MSHLIMGTAGHVDHGKTALIKALTNVDCDTHPVEKRRGITINLGFTYLELPSGGSIGIIDVPGHKDFIHTMVAGVSGIDIVLFVIAANSGIMPQTREHFNILDVLGIKKGIIVLTKVDLVENDLLTFALDEINDFVKGSFLENAPVIQVSSIKGTGVDKLKEAIDKLSSEVKERSKGRFFRMYIDRMFNVQGFGAVLTGTVSSGEAYTSTPVYLQPGNEKKFRIRRIEKYGNPTEKIVAGDRAAINIVGLERTDFSPGKVITDTMLDETKLIDAKLSLFKHSFQMKSWSKVIFHSGMFTSSAKIHLLNRNELNGGEDAMVQIYLEKPCVVLHGDKFVFRNTSSDKTLGGGIIIDTHPLHHRRRTQKLIQSMSELAEGGLVELIRMEVNKSLMPIDSENIARNLNKSNEEIITICEVSEFQNVKLYHNQTSIILINKERDFRFTERITGYIRSFHKRNPLIPAGLSFSEIISKLGFAGSTTGTLYCDLIMRNLEKSGFIKKWGDTWILSQHSVVIPDHIKKDLSWLIKIINDYKMQSPLLSEMKTNARKRGINESELKQYLFFLTRTGEVYQIGEEFLGSEVVDRCRKILLSELIRDSKGITVSQFRDLISGNRKIALLLLAQYDLENIIRRDGDFRYITENGRKIFNSLFPGN